MSARQDQIDAFKRLTSSAAFKAAEEKLEFWAVVLIGTLGRVPKAFGDNYGWWPGRVGITRDPKEYARRIDLEQSHEHVALEVVWTESHRHALRLKAKLDVLLLGEAEINRIRHGWRDLDDPEITWPILLGQALDEIRECGEAVEVFSSEMRLQRIINEARKRGRG